MLTENLKSYRKLKGWTQEKMAAEFKEFNLSRDNIASYERGIAQPSLAFACKICDDIKVSLHTFLYEEILNPKIAVTDNSNRVLELEAELTKAYKTIAQMQMEKMQVVSSYLKDTVETKAAEDEPDK